MKKRYSLAWYTYPIIGLIISLMLLIATYYMCDFLGLKQQLNTADKTIFVGWIRVAVNPKNYFKLFYNLSIILLPSGGSLIGYALYKKNNP